jgi:hypothetical protein
MLKQALRLLFGSPELPRQPFGDPILGELKPCALGWTASVGKGLDSFRLTVGGHTCPASALLAHAREIFNDYESFKTLVKDFVEAEIKSYPLEAKTELSQMEIDEVLLAHTDQPKSGMIYFRGPADYVGVWRCDYVEGKPQGLVEQHIHAADSILRGSMRS